MNGKILRPAALTLALALPALAFSIESPALTTLLTQWSVQNQTKQISQYLAQIDQLYSQYDEVMNTLTMIQNQYQQYQHLLKEAQQWDFSNIRWDGDFDFRNEIKSATSAVNRQLTTLRRAEECLTKKKFSSGGVSYSMADLFDFGNGGAARIAAQSTSGNLKKMADTWAGNLSESEKKAIWRKYGLSASNYYYVGKKTELMDDISSKCIAAAQDDVVQAQLEDAKLAQNAVMQKILEDEDQSPKSLSQKTALLFGQLGDSLAQLGAKMDMANAMAAMRETAERQDAEQRDAQREALETKRVADDNF